VFATDWANLTVAGAFVVGAVAGTVATIRVVKHIAQFWDRERHEPPHPDP
jgi:hypothetical protein